MGLSACHCACYECCFCHRTLLALHIVIASIGIDSQDETFTERGMSDNQIVVLACKNADLFARGQCNALTSGNPLHYCKYYSIFEKSSTWSISNLITCTFTICFLYLSLLLIPLLKTLRCPESVKIPHLCAVRVARFQASWIVAKWCKWCSRTTTKHVLEVQCLS